MTNDLSHATPDTSDTIHMRRALAEADASARRGDLGVGAVVVLGDRIVASGGNEASSTGNPFAHAEIQALTDFTQKNPSSLLAQATLYSTFEPCPMCLGACLVVGLGTIVVGGTRQAGDRQWGGYKPAAFAETVGLSGPRISIRQGPLGEECVSVRSRSLEKAIQQQLTCTTDRKDKE